MRWAMIFLMGALIGLLAGCDDLPYDYGYGYNNNQCMYQLPYPRPIYAYGAVPGYPPPIVGWTYCP